MGQSIILGRRRLLSWMMSCHRFIRAQADFKGVGISLIIAGMLVLAAVMSIHPLYEDVSPQDPDIVFEKDLTCSWSATGGKCSTILTVSAKDEIYDFRSVEQGEGCGE